MTPDVIRAVVEKNRPGAYILGDVDDGHFVFKYVGLITVFRPGY
jgi:hypothetical protein